KERTRDVYERAIANVPPAEEKRYWQRYIYLWINYALYEELDAGDMERTRVVYRECLNQIPHHKFSFAKVWLLAAQFEIRQLNLKGARQILGNAIGKAPKSKIFKKYIEMELQLSNIDRCRKLYEKYLQWSPENCYAWSKYAELERSLSETDRARAIFDLAIGQPALDMPELLWKTYIDFEISEFEFERARGLYERLLDRTKHLKVWISYADFEATATDKTCLDLSEQEQKKQCIQRARRVFEEALNYFRSSAPDLKEERAMLLDKWIDLEVSSGELGDVSLVQSKLPKKLKKRRQVSTEEDGSSRIEEFIDYLFPEETQTTNLKILEAAYKWKKQKL
ncbi:crooked neck 1-like protein, partial [Trifolium pratense]